MLFHFDVNCMLITIILILWLSNYHAPIVDATVMTEYDFLYRTSAHYQRSQEQCRQSGAMGILREYEELPLSSNVMICRFAGGGLGNRLDIFWHCFLSALFSGRRIYIHERITDHVSKHFDFPEYVHDLAGRATGYAHAARDILACALFIPEEQRPSQCNSKVLIYLGGECNYCNPVSDHILVDATRRYGEYFYEKLVQSNPAVNVSATMKSLSVSDLVGCAANRLLHPGADVQEMILPYVRSFRKDYDLTIGFHMRTSDIAMAAAVGLNDVDHFNEGITASRNIDKQQRIKEIQLEQWQRQHRNDQSKQHHNKRRKLPLATDMRKGCMSIEAMKSCIKGLAHDLKIHYPNIRTQFMLGADSHPLIEDIEALATSQATNDFSTVSVSSVQGMVVHSLIPESAYANTVNETAVEEGKAKIVADFFILTMTDVFISNCEDVDGVDDRNIGNSFAYNVFNLRMDPMHYTAMGDMCNQHTGKFFHIPSSIESAIYLRQQEMKSLDSPISVENTLLSAPV